MMLFGAVCRCEFVVGLNVQAARWAMGPVSKSFLHCLSACIMFGQVKSGSICQLF